MRRYGIESMRATYSKEFVVELEQELPDGKPWAVKLRQVRPMLLLAIGESIPVPSEGNGSQSRLVKGELTKKYKAMREIVAQAVSAVREVDELDDGTLAEVWTPVTMIYDRAPGEGEMHVDEIDLPNSQNITRCWNTIFSHATSIEKRVGVEDASFRPEGPLDASGDVETVRTSPARVGLRKAGSRGL